MLAGWNSLYKGQVPRKGHETAEIEFNKRTGGKALPLRTRVKMEL
jgi:hypothetical protein